jgi:hypothetical protein
VAIIDIATTKQLWKSDALSLKDFAAAKTRGKDISKKLVDDAGEFLDNDEFELAPLDKADRVKLIQRAELNIELHRGNPLASLAEMRVYVVRKLASADVAEKANLRVLGNAADSQTLIDGDAAARKAIGEKYADSFAEKVED